MTGILFAIGFIALQLLFGFLVGRIFLRIRSVPALAGMACVLGQVVYLISTNALGYVLPVQTAFLVIVLLQVAACVMLAVNIPKLSALQWPPRWVFLSLSGLGVLAGFATARFLTSDPWMWSYLPLTSTIMAGNFPAHEPINPTVIAGYHYGPQLLAAAFSSLTGLSLAVAYNIQPFWCALGGLYLSAALLYSLTRSWLAAFLGSVLFFAGAGLTWINGWALPVDGLPVIARMFGSTLGPSLLLMFGSRGYTFLFPLLAAFLFLVQECAAGERRVPLWRSLLLLVALALALALSAEWVFLMLYPAAVIFLFLLPRTDRRRMMMLLGVALAIALPFAFLQGGVLTPMLMHQFGPRTGPSDFALNFDWSIAYLLKGDGATLWSWLLIREGGIPYVLMPVLCVFGWRRRKEYPLLLFILPLMILLFLAGLFVRYVPRPIEMDRFHHTAFFLSSMLIGVMLSVTWLRGSRPQRIAGWLLVGAMLLSAAVYLPMRLVFPTMRRETAPLFAQLPPVTEKQHTLYEWVREHSTIKDYFYQETVTPEQITRSDPEEKAQQRLRILFMTYTGRYSVGFLLWGAYTQEFLDHQQAIESSCSLQDVRALGIRYLVIETPSRDMWFRSFCASRDWRLQYSDPSGLPAVYERVNR